MINQRPIKELRELLDEYDLVLTQPKDRFIIEFLESEYVWYFDNLSEVDAFVTGIEFIGEFWTS